MQHEQIFLPSEERSRPGLQLEQHESMVDQPISVAGIMNEQSSLAQNIDEDNEF